jgi:prepilin signal peptidase PulO-like enzyme (type II secretory pathway)
MNSPASYELLFAVFAFALGACIGSFLNVCIYRLPLDLSVNEPRRSFCPACKAPIPWQHNLPLFSWLFLRGRCANCGARIAFRYFAVELITALMFLAVWRYFSWPIAIAYWVLVSLLIAGTSSAAVTLASLGFIAVETWMWPSSTTLLVILGSSTALVAGQYWLITGMRTGEIAVVAPFRYSVTLWAVLAGYLVWRETPDLASWVGIAIVTAAGLYTFLREQRLAKAAR